MVRKFLLAFNLLILVFSLVQCSSEDSESETTVEANFVSLWDNGLNTCGACHDGVSDDSIGDLDPNIYDLSTKASWEVLKNKTPAQGAGGCSYLGNVPVDSVIAQSVVQFDSVGACESETYNFHFEKSAIPTAPGFADALKKWLTDGANF